LHKEDQPFNRSAPPTAASTILPILPIPPISAFQFFSVSAFQRLFLAAKPPSPSNYFHFCTSVNFVRPPSNSRIHNALRKKRPPFFDQKIIRTVRMHDFQNHA
jgi:hypothetical protein